MCLSWGTVKMKSFRHLYFTYTPWHSMLTISHVCHDVEITGKPEEFGKKSVWRFMSSLSPDYLNSPDWAQNFLPLPCFFSIIYLNFSLELKHCFLEGRGKLTRLRKLRKLMRFRKLIKLSRLRRLRKQQDSQVPPQGYIHSKKLLWGRRDLG